MKQVIFRLEETEKQNLKSVLAKKGTTIQEYFEKVSRSLILEKNKETATV
jgi:hypothetical protein